MTTRISCIQLIVSSGEGIKIIIIIIVIVVIIIIIIIIIITIIIIIIKKGKIIPLLREILAEEDGLVA